MGVQRKAEASESVLDGVQPTESAVTPFSPPSRPTGRAQVLMHPSAALVLHPKHPFPAQWPVRGKVIC